MALRRIKTQVITPAQEGTARVPFCWSVIDKDGVEQHLSLAVWQAANGGWYLLGKRGYAAFARSTAEFYIPFGNIADCPAS